MDARIHESASYVLPGDTKAEKNRRQEQGNEYQRQQRTQRASMSDIPEDPHHQNSPKSGSRKRADSHQPASTTSRSRRSVDASHTERIHPAAISAHLRSSHDYERPRRYSSADYGYDGNRLSPQLSPSNPRGEIRRLSGNFNAPTHVEVERDREHRKSLKGMEKLRSKFRGWVKA